MTLNRIQYAIRADRAAAILILSGVVLRVLWAIARPGQRADGEAFRVASAIAGGRGFADAYGQGQGPTAHLSPISPSIGGFIYGLFGIASPISEFVLTCWAIALAVTTFVLLYRSFAHIGVPQSVRWVGLALALLLPSYFSGEVVDFRLWDGGLAACLAAAFLERLTSAIAREQALPREKRNAARIPAILAAILTFVNPPLGLCAAMCLVVDGLGRLPMRRNIEGMGFAVAVLALMAVPWGLRNQAALHSFIPFRSNAGLELALANYPQHVDANESEDELVRRLLEIHPSASRAAFARVKKVGEVAYAQEQGAGALQFIEHSPVKALTIWMRHIREWLWPSTWRFAPHQDSKIGIARAWMVRLVSLGALAGLIVLTRRRVSMAIYPAILTLGLIVVMSPFEPVARYTYVVYPTLCFLSACALIPFAARMPAWAARRMGRV